MKKLFGMAVLLGAVLAFSSTASATAIILAASSGGRAAATRITDVGGGVVTVELLNFGSLANQPDDILTGLFLNISGTFAPIPVSAFTSVTSTIVGNPGTGCMTPTNPSGLCPSGSFLNVGGEWESLVTGAVVPYDYGISSSGYGVFGSSGNFNGPNLSDPEAPNGANFGMVSGIGLSPNGGVTAEPLTTGIVTFTLSGLIGFNPATQITGARFQYGTGLDHPFIVSTPGVATPFDVPGGSPVPEPASMLLLGTGLVGLAARARKRFRN